MSRFCLFALACSCLFLSACTNKNAETLTISPGEWEIVTTSNISILPHAISDTVTKCLSSKDLSPSTLMEEGSGCSFTDFESTGSTIAWKMSCTKTNGTLHGEGKLETTTREAFSGGIQLMVPAEENALVIGKNWEAKYLGPCQQEEQGKTTP